MGFIRVTVGHSHVWSVVLQMRHLWLEMSHRGDKKAGTDVRQHQQWLPWSGSAWQDSKNSWVSTSVLEFHKLLGRSQIVYTFAES